MKKFTNQFNGSHAGRINNGGGRFRRIALFPLMLFMLLLVPTSMVAQTDYDNTVTFTALAGSPEGMSEAESYHKLFDGQKKEGNSTKWCCDFYGSAYVIFEASKAGIPVGYTITTGNDNSNWKGRNPKSWKLYGNNEGQNGNWTLIQEVNNDTKLQDVNCTSYDFTCGGGKSYKYFKWEISAIHSGDVLQVGEFELKLQTCTHTNADGSSALGNAIKTVETTCTEHGYTTYKCSICHSIVKKYKTDELKKHTLTYHEAKDGVKEHWQCDVCHKYFSDADATQEVSYASLLYPAYAVFDESTGTLTFKCSPSKPEGAYDLNVGFETPGWFYQRNKIKKVVFDASFANARPTNCYIWFKDCSNLTTIEGIEYFNTENVTNMLYMFDGCWSLKSLDLTNFNTENVTDMYYMFAYCKSLESLDLTNFNTAKVTNMAGMFQSCYALKTIYASDKFVTDQVTESTCMFSDCLNLKDYTSSKEDHTYANCKTGYFTYGRGYAMFDNATETLTFSYKGFKPEGAYELNEGGNTPEWISKNSYVKKVVFDASFVNARPTSCNEWFFSCSNLTTIEGIEYLNTAKVTNMNYMFDNCESLKSLDLTKFNTENVTSMKFMFEACTTLTSLDVSNFNTAKVTDINYMFSNCSALTTIYASDNFVTDQVTYGNYMFNGCEKLNGYDGSKTDHNYANYRTGYFSKLVGKNGDEKIGASGEALTAASLALDDEKDFVAYEPFTATTATYNREMKEGTIWATLCLPFEVSLADKNFRAFKLLSANESTSTIQLEEITTSITAGTPVIIKMNNGETTLSISEANKEIAQKVVSAADGSYLLQGIYTQKVFDKVADNNCYIVKGDKLMNPTKLLENTSTTQVGSKPFRAYMVDNTSSSAGAKMFSIAIGGGTTAIDSLNTIADDNATYYDLQGNRLNAPQKGINIVKRGSKTMKVIIK